MVSIEGTDVEKAEGIRLLIGWMCGVKMHKMILRKGRSGWYGLRGLI